MEASCSGERINVIARMFLDIEVFGSGDRMNVIAWMFLEIHLDRYRLYIKMRDSKKCRKYKTGEKYSQICMETKLAIASYKNPNKLLN